MAAGVTARRRTVHDGGSDEFVLELRVSCDIDGCIQTRHSMRVKDGLGWVAASPLRQEAIWAKLESDALAEDRSSWCVSVDECTHGDGAHAPWLQLDGGAHQCGRHPRPGP